jgi:hypothetical protein
MALEDREQIVATVQETYALMGRALGTDIPGQIRETALRPEVLQAIIEAELDPYVTDEEMLALLREAYFDLVGAVIRLQEALLGELGWELDPEIEAVGLSGSGLRLKVAGFRRSLNRIFDRIPGVRRIKKVFEWGNIILGSLGGVPVVGVIADPIRELKESIEAQGDEDQEG